MSQKTYIKFLVYATLIAVAVFITFYIVTSKPGVYIPYSKVNNFTDSQQFHNSFFGYPDIQYLNDPSDKTSFFSLNQYNLINHTSAFPKDSKYLLVKKSEIQLYNADSRLEKKISITEFSFDPKLHCFGDVILTTSDKTYIRIERLDEPDDSGGTAFALLQLTSDLSPAISKLHHLDNYSSIAIDVKTSTAFVFRNLNDKSLEFYNLDTGQFTGKSLPLKDFSNPYIVFAVYNPVFKKILIKVICKKVTLALLDPDTGSITTLTEITHDYCNWCWASDGKIYYNRKNRLWRIDPLTKQKRIIFVPSRICSDEFMNTIALSPDGRFIAFFYSVQTGLKNISICVLLLDTKNAEYQNISLGSMTKI